MSSFETNVDAIYQAEIRSGPFPDICTGDGTAPIGNGGFSLVRSESECSAEGYTRLSQSRLVWTGGYR